MAVSTDNYFSNSIVGVPQLGADIDVYATESSPKYAVGFGFTRADGNKYRYSHFGAVVARGALCAVDLDESGATKIDNVGTDGTRRSGELFMPNVIDSKYLQLVITATADQFAGGYLTVTTGSGVGYTYRVQGNTVTQAIGGVDGQVYMDLYDKVQTQIDTTTDIIIAGSHYANLEGITTTDMIPAGVAVTGVTATDYGWVCTHGVMGVLQDAAIGTAGAWVYVSSNTTAAVGCINTPTLSPTTLMVQPIVGTLIEPGTSADYSLVYLQIE
jgi:hypothetical protein